MHAVKNHFSPSSTTSCCRVMYGKPNSIFFIAGFAVLTGTSCIPVLQITKGNICLSPLVVVRRSSSALDLSPGENMTLFCEVIGNPSLYNRTDIEWSVWPDWRFMIDASFQHQISADGNRIRATLTLRNITVNYTARYTIKFSNMCGSVSCSSSLEVDDCSYVKPIPMQREVTINVSQNRPTVRLVASFIGDPDPTHSPIVWRKGMSDLRKFGQKYTEHRKVSDCSFTEELIIHNLSVNDAGEYSALFPETRANTTFYVYITNNQEDQKKKAIFVYEVSAVSLGVLLAVMLAVGVGVCFKIYHKKKLRNNYLVEEEGSDTETEREQEEPESDQHELEQEEVDAVVQSANPQPPAPRVPGGQNRVFFLYCKAGVSEESLVDMAHVLTIYGVSSCLDVTVEAIPANWSIWTEERIESCHYIILVCTRPLYRALRDHINDADSYLVEMFKGKFYACAVVNHVQSPKFIPVFIDHTPDVNMVPSQLRTHHFYHLRIRELMQAVEGKPEEYVDSEIKNNPLFMDIKQLIDLLQ